MAKKKTHEEYVAELAITQPNLEVLERYIDSVTPLLHRCTIDGYTWPKQPVNSTQKHGCPVCAGQVIGPPPEYKNSIWTSKYKEYFSKYLTEEQMKQYTPHSTRKITIPCPDCGRMKETSLDNLFYNGLCCICNDGQKFPNKFMFHILSQLDIKFQPEYTPKWANKKRYDDYLLDYNIIIENHGLQHYEECTLTTRTLAEEQDNDLLKYNLAMQNGISKYIVLDCRKSNADWIKNSIMNSELPTILHFSEDDIDWKQAQEYAVSNLVKQAADLFVQGYKIQDIAAKLYKTRGTIRIWLKSATEIGWCEYVPKTIIPVYCVEANKRYRSFSDGAREMKTYVGHIKDCCEGKRSHAGRVPETNEPASWLSIDEAIQLGYLSI